jgi:hypothetical protein
LHYVIIAKMAWGNILGHGEADFTRDDSDSVDDEVRLKSFDAVVYNSDWTVETIISQLDQGNIDINPMFQRRDAWDSTRKSLFIESLLLGLPVPQIVLAERDRGEFVVLDGKQRLITLLQFTGRTLGGSSPLKLKGLAVLGHLNGVSFERLLTDPQFRDEKKAFLNHIMRSVVIRDWKDDTFLYLLFVRLNTGSVQLSPQELRSALFPGPFTSFIDDAAVRSEPLKDLLRLRHADFRMRDVELLLRYVSFETRMHAYDGRLKEFLDTTCKTLNKKWKSSAPLIEDVIEGFDRGCHRGRLIFGENFGKKWSGQSYERSLNRAVLDVQLHYLSQIAIADLPLGKRVGIATGFQHLCEERPFVSAIESTTKSIVAVGTRFKRFAEMLAEVMGQPVEPHVPERYQPELEQ